MKKLISMLALSVISQAAFAQSCPSTCSNGTVVGEFTPSSSLSGGGNVFMGAFAGSDTTTGSGNAFFGQEAGYHNQTGSNNTFIGKNAGVNNTLGSDNTIMGVDAGVSNSTGTNNTMLGSSAGTSNSTGSHNVYIGRNAGRTNLAGEFNVALGFNSGYHNQGDRSVFIGHKAGEFEAGSNMLYIANSPYNPLLKGDFSSQWLNVSNKLGIGKDNPSEALEVVGNGIANQWLTYSDERLKEDIRMIKGAMDKVALITGISYRLKMHTNKQDTEQTDDRTYGVSAQTIKKVIPDLVQEDNKGLLSVNYDGLIPLLIEALKEKDQEIKIMQKQLDSINQKLSEDL